MSKHQPVPPALGKPAFNCPYCGAFADQQWVDIGYEVEDPEGDYFQDLDMGLPLDQQVATRIGETAENLSWVKRSTWQATQCFSCKDWAIWRGKKMVHPPLRLSGTPHPDMPDEVRELYDEAAQIAAVSTRAGAAFARVAVERLLKHLFPDTDSKLEHLIAAAKRRGVSSPVGQMLDVVRVTGNGAVHVDDQPGDLVILVLDDVQGPELVSMLLQAINDLVDDLITKPQQAAKLSALIPPSVQARIEKLSASSSTNEP